MTETGEGIVGMPADYDPANDEIIISRTIECFIRMDPLRGSDGLGWRDWAVMAMSQQRVELGYPSTELITNKHQEVGEVARKLYESRQTEAPSS